MSNFVKIKKKLKNLIKIYQSDGDKSLSIRWALISFSITLKSKS